MNLLSCQYKKKWCILHQHKFFSVCSFIINVLMTILILFICIQKCVDVIPGTVFAHFGQCAYALSLSTGNEDLQHYLVSSLNQKVDVDDNFLLYYPRPNVG